MKSLEAQFQDIIDARINTFDVEEVGKLIVERTLQDTERGIDATGAPFMAYKPQTATVKGNSVVNLRHYARGMETLHVQGTFSGGGNLGATLAFSGESGRSIPDGIGSNKATGQVLGMHQKGTARGGKQRKVFLEPEDMTSIGANELFQEITKVLAKHFNGN